VVFDRDASVGQLIADQVRCREVPGRSCPIPPVDQGSYFLIAQRGIAALQVQVRRSEVGKPDGEYLVEPARESGEIGVG
jgi:hypothetical protein